MHKNLIKISDFIAFAKNNEGVISLLLKKTKDYSFEDIINKEQEIAELSNNVKKLNIEKDNAKATKTGSRLLLLILLAFLMFIIYISVSFHIILGAFLLLLPLGILAIFKEQGFGIKEAIKPKDTKGIEEELEKARELLNTKKEELEKARELLNTKKEELEKARELLNSKKEELERMLNQVDFREYSNRNEIESILSNMFNINQSKEYSNTLNKDVSNEVTLEGPTLNRRRD